MSTWVPDASDGLISNRKYRCKPTASRSKVRRLALIEARRRQKKLAVIYVKPDISLANFGSAVELDHPFAGRRKILSDVSTLDHLGPHSLRYLVAAIDSLASVAADR